MPHKGRVKLSSFLPVAIVLLAGCESAPAPKPATAARPVAKPTAAEEPQNPDIGELLRLDLDASDPVETIPAKIFPVAELAGYRIALAEDLSMPAVKAAPLPTEPSIIQITSRVCNRGSVKRTVDFLCQVGQQPYHYELSHVVFPPHSARDLRLRIESPDEGATVWLSVKDTKTDATHRPGQVMLRSDKAANQQKLSVIVQDPPPAN
jgi:hypothetical protein